MSILRRLPNLFTVVALLAAPAWAQAQAQEQPPSSNAVNFTAPAATEQVDVCVVPKSGTLYRVAWPGHRRSAWRRATFRSA